MKEKPERQKSGEHVESESRVPEERPVEIVFTSGDDRDAITRALDEAMNAAFNSNGTLRIKGVKDHC